MDVIPNDTVRLDFSLPAGWVETLPETLAITLEQGLTGSLPLTLTNQGDWPAVFNLLEIDYSMTGNEGNTHLNHLLSPGWYDGAPLPAPRAVSASAKCADDPDSFYLVGGQEDFLVPVNTVWRYDADVDQWVTLAPLPQPVELASATCYEGKIYVAGGWNVNDLRTLYIYDIASNTWSRGAYALRLGLRIPALGAWNGQLYLVNWVFNDVYNIQENHWVPEGGSPMPQPVEYTGWAQVGNYLYVVGGYGAGADLIQRYDMATDTWELGPVFRSERAIFALVATEKYLYAIGGDLPGGDYFEQTSLVEVLDHTAWPLGAWHDLNDPTPQEIGFQSGFCTQESDIGRIWSVGGGYGSVYATDFNWYRPSELCHAAPSDVAWLSVEPVSGTLEAEGTSSIQITFNAGLPELEPGEYRARLRVGTDTPYGASFIPILMTVVLPDYAMEFGPPAQVGFAPPGEAITYTLVLTNTGTKSDTYDLTDEGNEWVVTLPVTQTTLAPGESITMTALVTVPEGALAGEVDSVTITATSQGDPAQSASAALTTTVLAVYAPDLGIESPALSGYPGAILEYSVQLTNIGNITDTFDLSYSGNAWDVSLPITQTVLTAGEMVALNVQVVIPANASDGTQDAATITVTSQGDPAKSASIVLTTTAVWHRVFLPVLIR